MQVITVILRRAWPLLLLMSLLIFGGQQFGRFYPTPQLTVQARADRAFHIYQIDVLRKITQNLTPAVDDLFAYNWWDSDTLLLFRNFSGTQPPDYDLMDANGRNLRPLALDTNSFDIAPDGDHMTFVRRAEDGGFDIYLSKVNNREAAVNITDGRVHLSQSVPNLSWQSNSASFIFTSQGEDQLPVIHHYDMASNQLGILDAIPGVLLQVSWVPGSASISYIGEVNSAFGIYVSDLAGHARLVLPLRSQAFYSLSPDGQLLAVIEDFDELKIASIDGDLVTVIAAPPRGEFHALAWSSDGRQLATVQSQFAPVRNDLLLIDVASSQPQTAIALPDLIEWRNLMWVDA